MNNSRKTWMMEVGKLGKVKGKTEKSDSGLWFLQLEMDVDNSGRTFSVVDRLWSSENHFWVTVRLGKSRISAWEDYFCSSWAADIDIWGRVLFCHILAINTCWNSQTESIPRGEHNQSQPTAVWDRVLTFCLHYLIPTKSPSSQMGGIQQNDTKQWLLLFHI